MQRVKPLDKQRQYGKGMENDPSKAGFGNTGETGMS
jgi:hypothetical protein